MTSERALARSEDAHVVVWTDDKVRLLKEQIADPDATDDELELFMLVCDRKQLDPFSRQIYAVWRYDKRLGRKKMTIQTSIDGFRLIARRTGKFAGRVGPYWCGEDGVWTDVWLKREAPAAAKVGVRTHGDPEPTFAVAHWDEYVQTYQGRPSGLWGSMPRQMIAKCAESQALRAAFPEELSGLYTTEEMAQADNTAPTPHPQPKAQRKQPRKPESIAPPADAEGFDPPEDTIDGEYTEVVDEPAPKPKKGKAEKSGDTSDPTQYLNEVIKEANVVDDLKDILEARYGSGTIDALAKDEQRNLFTYMRVIAGLKKASSYEALTALYERFSQQPDLWDDFAQVTHDDRLAALAEEAVA